MKHSKRAIKRQYYQHNVIIELLGKINDEMEDGLLIKSGFLKYLIEDAKASSSSSDWQRELDKL